MCKTYFERNYDSLFLETSISVTFFHCQVFHAQMQANKMNWLIYLFSGNDAQSNSEINVSEDY